MKTIYLAIIVVLFTLADVTHAANDNDYKNNVPAFLLTLESFLNECEAGNQTKCQQMWAGLSQLTPEFKEKYSRWEENEIATNGEWAAKSKLLGNRLTALKNKAEPQSQQKIATQQEEARPSISQIARFVDFAKAINGQASACLNGSHNDCFELHAMEVSDETWAIIAWVADYCRNNNMIATRSVPAYDSGMKKYRYIIKNNIQ